MYEFEIRRGGQRQWVDAIVVRPATARSKFVEIQYHPWRKVQVRCGARQRHYVDVCLTEQWRSRVLRSDEDLSRLRVKTID